MKIYHRITSQVISRQRCTLSHKAPAESMWNVARSLSPYPGRIVPGYSFPSKAIQARNKISRLTLAVLFASLALVVSSLRADEIPQSNPSARPLADIEIDTNSDPKAIAKSSESKVIEEVTLNSSYAGKADVKSGSGGKLDEQTTDFNYSANIPLRSDMSLLAGVRYNRLDFGQSGSSPLPNSLETVSIPVGINYKISDRWGFFGVLSPQLNLLNGWDEIQSQDIRLGVTVGATYEFNNDLSGRFGLAINSGQEDSPVIPLVGLNWHFAEFWTLNFGFPKTSIDYQLFEKLRLSVIELGFQGGTYHTGSSYGNSVGHPELNDRDLVYTEIRVGTGASYTLTKNVDLQASTGVVAYREFDFKDSGYKQKVDPAPYIQLGVKVGF